MRNTNKNVRIFSRKFRSLKTLDKRKDLNFGRKDFNVGRTDSIGGNKGLDTGI